MSSAPGAAIALAELLGGCHVERLANGFEVCVLANRQAPLVSTALWYRAGTADEPAGRDGIAHFLEHMMFKGSPGFAAGEIDRLTQRLGGVNNAFTGHDASCYHFTFAREKWVRALDVEADRMTALAFDPVEIDRERQVIGEEIAMYEDDPWDSLEQAVWQAAYGEHPYGRPVLGDRDGIAATGAEDLAAFHRRHYHPGNAVMVIAGDVDPGEATREVERRFGALAGARGKPEEAPVGQSVETPGEDVEGPPRRLERRRGRRDRFLVALPAPPANRPEYVDLWLAIGLLAGGRAGRLQRALVDDGRLCASVSVDLTEMVGPGLVLIAAEPLPGVETERVEAALGRELTALAAGAEAGEFERARRLLLADWVYGLERIHHQALFLGGALARFDLDTALEFPRRVEQATLEDLRQAAARFLVLGPSAVVAWSRAAP